ncbi:MAG: hypothetical protein KAI55_00390, partial [Candidatus Aenigmarchaeota archaeon]|nr:hypothetical protein [Candidatus Aenigmarchaeota archaeon]
MNEEYILFSKKGNKAKIIYNDSFEIIIKSFKIEYYVSGKAYLILDIKRQNSENVQSISKIEFKGETDEGFVFEIDITEDFNENPFYLNFFCPVPKRIQLIKPFTLKSNKEQPKKLKQYFTNFLFDYNSTNTNGFLIKIENKNFCFKKPIRYKENKKIIEKTNIPKITGYMESEIVDDYDKQKNISRNIFELVSYSQRQFIQVVYDELVNQKNEVVKIIIHPQVLRPARAGFTVVESNLLYEQDQTIIKFIEETYVKYIEWKEKIKLDYSLTYYFLAFIPKQGEVEYILVFTAVES